MERKKGKIKEEKNNSFNLTLVIITYLILDIIILFFLCLLELNGVSHITVLALSFVLEALMTIFVTIKSNIKTSIIFYILLLVTPVFLNLIAMGMHYITDAMPFTPTILLLFRSGYDLKGNLLNRFMRFVISFRIPSLMVIVCSSIIYLIRKDK